MRSLTPWSWWIGSAGFGTSTTGPRCSWATAGRTWRVSPWRSSFPRGSERLTHDTELTTAEQPEPRPMGSGRELIVVRRDGTELKVEIGLGPLWVDGELQVVCTLHDLTGLGEREDRIQQLVDAMPGLFYIFDAEGRLTWWNRHLEEVLGYTTEELDGRHVLDFIHPDDREHVAERVGCCTRMDSPGRQSTDCSSRTALRSPTPATVPCSRSAASRTWWGSPSTSAPSGRPSASSRSGSPRSRG